MAVMGEESPERWADEWRRTGRVVFPLRRRPVLWGFAQLLVVGTVIAVFGLPDMVEYGGGARIAAFVLAPLYVFGIGLGIWQLVAQRPVVIVDQDGIRRGKRKFMPWSEIGAIGIANGSVWGMSLPIIPKDAWGKDLRLYQQNVRHMPAFRRWLEILLAEHRTNSTS